MLKSSDKKITKDTYEEIAESFEAQHKLTPEITTTLNKFVSLVSGKRVLDIGCADGLETQYLYTKGLDVIGIDFSSSFIQIAKKKYPKIDFKEMDMETLDFEEGTFDGIWANASFIHIPKERGRKVILGFKKILKPDGILYISVKFGYMNRLWKNKFMKWGERHFSHYTKKEISLLLDSCGFDVLEMKREYLKGGHSWLLVFARIKDF